MTHPLEGLSITTDARALRAVTLITLELHGKFLVLVSIAPLCHPQVLTCVFTTDTLQSLGSFRPPARGALVQESFSNYCEQIEMRGCHGC